MEYIASISYGKDSLAMLEVIKQNNLPKCDLTKRINEMNDLNILKERVKRCEEMIEKAKRKLNT